MLEVAQNFPGGDTSNQKGRTTNAKEALTHGDAITIADGLAADAAAGLVLQRAQAGDVGAFEELVRLHYGKVFGVCLGVCGNRSDAEDAAQDAFVRAWRALPSFRGDSAVSTWLYRIATNVSLTLISRRRESVSDDVPERPDVTESPEGQFEGMERIGVVQQTLQQLTPDARAAFILRDIEGLSYDEIAQNLDITLSAVKSRIFRARQAVADALAAHDRDGGGR